MKVVRSSNVNVEDAFPLNMPCKLQFNLSMLQYMSLANDLGLYCGHIVYRFVSRLTFVWISVGEEI